MDPKKGPCQWESKRSRLNREHGTTHGVITVVYVQTDTLHCTAMRKVWEGLRKLNTGRKGRRRTIWPSGRELPQKQIKQKHK